MSNEGRALHDHYHEDGADHSGCSLNQKIAAIEAAERRATVERIRASATLASDQYDDEAGHYAEITMHDLESILDAEAAR